MNFPFYIARRYFFSKKTHNVINIISGISVFGIAISTMAMVLVMSGFNGIEHVIEEMYSAFDSDLKITLAKGKTFDQNGFPSNKLREIKGVEHLSFVAEETTILKTLDNWELAKMKGVEREYLTMNKLDDHMVKGKTALYDGDSSLAMIGGTLLNNLGTSIKDPYGITEYNWVHVVGLKGDEKLSVEREAALVKKRIQLGGKFHVNPKYDDSYIIVPLAFAQEVLGYDAEVTGVEVGLSDGADTEEVKLAVASLLGDKFKVEDKFDQNKLLFSTHRSEKWMTFFILCFIFILATFNMIASLTMLVLDKREDVGTLSGMGATHNTIRKIFISEGLLINFFGALVGIVLGLLIAWGQMTFGWVEMGSDTIVDAYPIRIIWLDMIWIFLTVLAVGTISTFIPVRFLLAKPT